jgi:hypothetical protein
MRQTLRSSSLSIGRKILYDLVRSKPLKQLNDSFKGLVLMLEGKRLLVCLFYAEELADDESVKGRVLDWVFLLDARVTYSKGFLADPSRPRRWSL